MQFLNVICFQSFKHYHHQALNQSLQLNVFDYNQLNFIADFNKIHMKIFKSFIILSVFKEADLIFYNSEKVLNSLHEKLKKLESVTSSSASSHSIDTASTWSTFWNISELHDYAIKMWDILQNNETSSTFHQQFDHFVTVSLDRTIVNIETEETLHKQWKKTQAWAKHQTGSRRIVVKGRVLNSGEAAHRIRDRRRNEVEQAQRTAQLRGTRGECRKAYACQLDFLAELDNPHRSAPCLEWAASFWMLMLG